MSEMIDHHIVCEKERTDRNCHIQFYSYSIKLERTWVKLDWKNRKETGSICKDKDDDFSKM